MPRVRVITLHFILFCVSMWGELDKDHIFIMPLYFILIVVSIHNYMSLLYDLMKILYDILHLCYCICYWILTLHYEIWKEILFILMIECMILCTLRVYQTLFPSIPSSIPKLLLAISLQISLSLLILCILCTHRVCCGCYRWWNYKAIQVL